MQNRQIKHYKDMTKEELIELVDTMSWMALNLAQHLDSTTNLLKVQYRKNCYNRAIEMAWQICYAWQYEKPQGNMEIAYFGGNGLEVINGDISELVDGTLSKPSDQIEIDFNYNDFDQLYMELDGGIPSIEEISEGENSLKYLRELTNDKVNRDHIDIKIKSLKHIMWKLESITNLAKASRKMLDMIDRNLWKPITQ